MRCLFKSWVYNNFTMPPLTMWNEILTSQTQWQGLEYHLPPRYYGFWSHVTTTPGKCVCPCQSLPSWHSVNTCFCPTQLWETWDIVPGIRELTHQWNPTNDYNGMWSRGKISDTDTRRCWEEKTAGRGKDPWSFNVFLTLKICKSTGTISQMLLAPTPCLASDICCWIQTWSQFLWVWSSSRLQQLSSLQLAGLRFSLGPKIWGHE